MKKLLIFSVSVLSLFLLTVTPVLSQCADPGGDDIGNCDSLYLNKVPGRLNASSQWTTIIRGYHDEGLGGIAVPIKYKNPQSDVHVDSIKVHSDISGTADIVVLEVDSTIGLLKLAAVWFDSLAPGTQTFFLVYFRTGPAWDPATDNPLDSMTIPGTSQTISYTTTGGADITPYYDGLTKGNLDVDDDNRRDRAAGIPTTFSLSQNFPNPFNAETVISFGLPKASHVRLEIFNILGQKVKDLVDERVAAGYKRVVWDGKDNNGNTVSSGVYFYKLATDEFTEVMKMTVLK